MVYLRHAGLAPRTEGSVAISIMYQGARVRAAAFEAEGASDRSP